MEQQERSKRKKDSVTKKTEVEVKLQQCIRVNDDECITLGH